MKELNFLSVMIFVITLYINISCVHKHKQKMEFQDSIVIFFRPIYTTKTVSATELIAMGNRTSVNDTIFVNNVDYKQIKEFIENKKYVSSNIKGVPEIYLKTNNSFIFLTQFAPLATDIRGRPIAISLKMLHLIYRSSKMYNYYTKEEILLDTLFKKYNIPQDYHYYYKKYNERYERENGRIDSVVAIKKRGIKLWLIKQ